MQTPDAYQAEADERNMNSRMLVEFVDGSKTMVEMAAIANADRINSRHSRHARPCGLDPKTLPLRLSPQKDGGVLHGIGRVDFSVGKGVAPGVFVIVEAEHPRIWERMKDLKMGAGPIFFLFAPVSPDLA